MQWLKPDSRDGAVCSEPSGARMAERGQFDAVARGSLAIVKESIQFARESVIVSDAVRAGVDVRSGDSERVARTGTGSATGREKKVDFCSKSCLPVDAIA